MSVFKSLTTGLEEAVQIESEQLKARKHKLTVTPVEDYTNLEIKEVRENLNMTQVIFAQILGVSKKTVEAWEAGINSPNGPAKRIIGMLKEDPSLPERYHIVSH